MRQPTVRLWSFFFNETFRISYCEVAKHVGKLRINFGTIKKITFLLVPPLVGGVAHGSFNALALAERARTAHRQKKEP